MAYRALMITLAGVLGASFLADDAEARHRGRWVYGYGGYYPGPAYLPPPPPRYYRYRLRRMSPEEYYDAYGDNYDPYFEPPVRKVKPLKKRKAFKNTKKKVAKTQAGVSKSQPAPKRKVAKSTAPNMEPVAAAPKKETVAAPKKEIVAASRTETVAAPRKEPVKTVAKSAPQPVASSKGGLSCEKAGTIISGYGFSGVKASNCSGQVYAFDAARDGKTYAIKLDSANGELTEVRKVR